MSNGFIFGKGRTPGGGGDWEVAAVEITEMTLSQVPSGIGGGNNCFFDGIITLPNHLVFQTREINSPLELWEACGMSRNNLMYSAGYLDGPNQVYVAQSISPGYCSVAIGGYAGEPVPVSSFTLYVFARFAD